NQRSAVMQEVHGRKLRHLTGHGFADRRMRVPNHAGASRSGHSVEIHFSVDVPHPRSLGTLKNQRSWPPESVEHMLARQSCVIHPIPPCHEPNLPYSFSWESRGYLSRIYKSMSELTGRSPCVRLAPRRFSVHHAW